MDAAPHTVEGLFGGLRKLQHWLIEPYQFNGPRVLLTGAVITILVAYILLGSSKNRLKLASPSIIGAFVSHYAFLAIYLWGVPHYLGGLAVMTLLFPGLIILLVALLFNMVEIGLNRRILPEITMIIVAILGHVFSVHSSFDPNNL